MSSFVSCTPASPAKGFNHKLANANVLSSPRYAHYQENPSGSNKRIRSNYVMTSPSYYSSPKQDRFIPDRQALDIDYCNHSINESENSNPIANNSTSQCNTHNEAVGVLLHTPRKRLLSCFQESVNVVDSQQNFLTSALTTSTPNVIDKSKRSIHANLPLAASKIMDAPDLMDDYYLNLVHWGKSNKIAIALKQTVYLWNAATGDIEQIDGLSEENDYVSSVKWSNNNDNIIAVGTSKNTVQIWDVSQSRMIREMSGHAARVGSLSWNNEIISSGSKDTTIINHDVRVRQNIVSKYAHHTQEVCGLAWSPDGNTLASGGNENYLCFWDAAISSRRPLQPSAGYTPRAVMNQHHAAVKALAWCPWQHNVLASGGGTTDRTIRLWNTSLETNLKVVDTGSQVCALVWNSQHKELVSSHGFSDNQLILWSNHNNNLQKIKEFRGHTARVLFLGISPDESTVCSASADETMRLWNFFGNRNNSNSLFNPTPTKSSPMLSSINSNFGMSLR